MTPTIALILYVVAIALAAVDLIQSHGRSLTAWAVLIVGLVLVFTQTAIKL